MGEGALGRVPVVTIGGFLGAGKTTLINRLLQESEGARIVVFVNDFGAINIDYDLIEAADENRISLKNGCVCCTLNDDLIGGIQGFLNEDARPAAFVIEASGVADPRALDSSIAILEKAGSVRLDNRVYVVDADGFQNSDFEDTEMIIDHAAAADCIVLNKADLVAGETLDRSRKSLKAASPYAAFVETRFVDCPPHVILGGEARGRPLGDGKASINVDPHHGFSSWSRMTDHALDRERFEIFAKKLPTFCIRAKGQLRFSTGDGVCVFHLVGRRATLEHKPSGRHDEPSKFVAIGKAEQMNADELDRLFDEIIV